ncbi:MAG: bifunctional diguanylate cyclase/phosphodiesterase [Actinobacteria bacterium]|nr:bifunctional diguanylate cyclase/phosphodiesterase [Actinomycetota bacterium]
MWLRRHRGIVMLLWAHVPALLLFGVLTGHPALHSALDLLPAVVLATVAGLPKYGRTVRSVLATLGLVTCSALAVHFAHGSIEMHFHFFVVIGVISLYQEWAPFGMAILFVVLHHGVIGVLAPDSVFDHGDDSALPWMWAAIHGAFVLAASIPHLLAWRLNEQYALRDPLTKLPNRLLVADRLSQALARRERFGSSVSLLFLDLDGFKGINDTLGHAYGDQVLSEVATRLTAGVRVGDTAGHLSGDEFAIILEAADEVPPEVTADRLLRAIAEPFQLGARSVTITASIGIDVADGTTTADDLLRNADLAMYAAKSAGRGNCRRYQAGMHALAVDQLDLVEDLRTALSDGSVFVQYQPVVELSTGEVIGVEALARWEHPTRGLVPPLVFVPVAERSGLIDRLGMLVLEESCNVMIRLHAMKPSLDLNVNLSPHQFREGSVVSAIADLLQATGLDPRRLVLEITEGVLIDEPGVAIQRIAGLQALGIRIALDDFGTGFSSLSYLKQFSVDALKIDRCFVSTLPASGGELAETIVRLGEMLDIDVVAEGIETDEQAVKLNALGCRHGQGYLFARPLDEDALGQLIAGGDHLGPVLPMPV